MTIFFSNLFPIPFSINVLEDTKISFDVTSTIPLKKDTLNVYIDGVLAYDGDLFLFPFNAPGSEINDVNIGGNDGYNVTIYYQKEYDNFVNVNIKVEDISTNNDSTAWSFLIDNEINSLYFCDGYGIKKANIRDLVGESQSIVRNCLNIDSLPSIPNNSISSIYGNRLADGNFYLSLSYDNFHNPDGYGVIVVKNEIEIDIYSNGYACYKGQITDDGKLYLINKDENQIEVYYGLYQFFGGPSRSPDFVYNSTSTPPIIDGEILTLHIVNNASSIQLPPPYSNFKGTRLYVGTENGLSRVDCRDQSNVDGTPMGNDHLGVSTSYSIVGGSGDHESIGGTIPKVSSISSDENNNIFMAVTQDGFGEGGVTQISLLTNKKIIFMSYEGGHIPSNNIRDIYGKGGG